MTKLRTNYVVSCWMGPRRAEDKANMADRTSFLRAHIHALETLPHSLDQVTVVLAEDIHKKLGRRHFIRGIVNREADGTLYARTTGGQGSGILRSMSAANGVIILPEDTDGARAGDVVEVYLIDSEEALSSDDE